MNSTRSKFHILIFILLEICAVVFLLNEKISNGIYNKKFCNDIFSAITKIKTYPSLQADYEKVVSENCKLKTLINNSKLQRSNEKKLITVLSAKVVNNIVSLNKNYFTIDKGAKSGIKEGMSVFTSEGFIGIIACVDEYYSTIIPIIHDNFYFSAKLNNSKVTGTIKWDGVNPKQTRLLYIPKYVDIKPGEHIFTSGFNSSICPNLLIGTVDHVEDTEDASFHSIIINLANDFNTLHEVYVMSNKLLQQKIDLEKKTIEQYG